MSQKKLLLYMGPCVLESESLALEVASFLKEELKDLEQVIDLSFKGSFDKANRSAIDSYRGPGLENGLKILETVHKKTGLKTITDFHLPDQAEPVASVVHTLQIPAFLCRQTDMICAGAEASHRYKRDLKVKKGQFLSPEETKNIVDKVATRMSIDQLILTERGSSFGYNNLVVDMASFMIMKSFGVRTVHDATHCVQRPGGLGNATGGKREQIQVLARAAIAAGADGIFMEVHPDPARALSDAATSIPLKNAPGIVRELVKLYQVVQS
jgi:2-dehydro-3-deoxyphosphooctonate aldolase (KDO 8-P synthase)